MDIEKRIYDLSSIEVRETGEGEDTKPIIDGYAAVYHRFSEPLGGFVEVIEPGFFDDSLGDDVVSLWNHNDDKPLGRTSAGTLEIKSDDHGLHTLTHPPDTTWGRDALISIGRRDVRQMSFAFSVKVDGDLWKKGEDGILVRHLLPGGCERLYDVSPVTYPAYPDTEVSARALGKVKELSGQVPSLDKAAEDAAKSQGRRAARKRQLEIKKRGL